MENVKKQIEKISDRGSFLAFLDALSSDCRRHPEAWENPTVHQYLEAMRSWMEDADPSEFHSMEEHPLCYAAVAKILYMGKIYE